MDSDGIPDFGKHYNAIGKMANFLGEQLKQADNLVLTEESEDHSALNARDQKVEEVRNILVNTKNVLKGIYSDTILASLGLQGETPSDPVKLQRVLEGAMAILSDVDENEPPPKKGFAFPKKVTSAFPRVFVPVSRPATIG